MLVHALLPVVFGPCCTVVWLTSLWINGCNQTFRSTDVILSQVYYEAHLRSDNSDVENETTQITESADQRALDNDICFQTANKVNTGALSKN
jgi:hypothetical protein